MSNVIINGKAISAEKYMDLNNILTILKNCKTIDDLYGVAFSDGTWFDLKEIIWFLNEHGASSKVNMLRRFICAGSFYISIPIDKSAKELKALDVDEIKELNEFRGLQFSYGNWRKASDEVKISVVIDNIPFGYNDENSGFIEYTIGLSFDEFVEALG